MTSTTAASAPLATMFDRPTNPKPGAIHWMLHRHAGGSAKFGPCEVCGAHCDAIYRQSAVVAYLDSEERGMCWTFHNAPPSMWGCLSCLLSLRLA